LGVAVARAAGVRAFMRGVVCGSKNVMHFEGSPLLTSGTVVLNT